MAQVSGKDARDILSIPSGSSGNGASTSAAPAPPAAPSRPPPTHGNKHNHRSKPKIDGITRELHALLGDNAPSLAVSHHGEWAHAGTSENIGAEGAANPTKQGSVAGGFRPKFVKRKERKVRGWEVQPFKNPARRDDLALSHWAPKETATDTGDEVPRRAYTFAAFNTSSGVYSYSNEEYYQTLVDEDWTKAETDHLMDLCQAYDLRFIIVADRWDEEHPVPAATRKRRTMEDLKARYYAICRRLIRNRVSIEDTEGRQQILATYSFDRNREIERKRMLARLFERTPAQLAEEEALYVESRRIEQNEAKFAADREDLLKLLGGWERIPDVTRNSIADAGAGIGRLGGVIPGSPGAIEEALALSESKRLKRRRLETGSVALADDDGVSLKSATATASTPAAPQLTNKQRSELKQAHFDEVNCITRFDPDSAPLTRPVYPHLVGFASTAPPVAPNVHNPSSSHGVYLRSARLLAPKQPQLNRTNQTLAELTPPIGTRLVFPTRQNCEKWEGLLGAVTSGLEMKKQTDRVESELRIAKNRLAALMGKGGAAPAASIPPVGGHRGSISSGPAAANASTPLTATTTTAATTPHEDAQPSTTTRRSTSSSTPRSSSRALSRSRTPGGPRDSPAVGARRGSRRKSAGLVGHDDEDEEDDEEQDRAGSSIRDADSMEVDD